jgi:phage FluMu protein Com
MLGGYCKACLEKQREIDRLQEEVVRLRGRLRYQERMAKDEGFFGSSTPSAKLPVKPNTAPVESCPPRRGGARVGHAGHGRQAATEQHAARVQTVAHATQRCPHCRVALDDRGVRRRTVIDCPPMRPETTVYRLQVKRCPRCRRIFQAQAPGVLPKSLYGNQLLTHLAVQHYVYGVPLGRLEAQTHIGSGSLTAALHRLRSLFAAVPEQLLRQYRRAPVKHADETGWRTDGHNGYVWLFATADLSLFRFRATRAAAVPKEVFGPERLPGVLVVDRYTAYNQLPCRLQYCYAHLLREVEDLERQFEENPEVQAFTSTFAPLLAEAMHLRALPISAAKWAAQARDIKQAIIDVAHQQAQHPGIHRIQAIFRDHAARLYHWAAHRKVPAENNLAERELRPLVIARKVSFGSQSEAGARTRETLMTVLTTLRRRFPDFQARFKNALDQLARQPAANPYKLLFRNHSPP